MYIYIYILNVFVIQLYKTSLFGMFNFVIDGWNCDRRNECVQTGQKWVSKRRKKVPPPNMANPFSHFFFVLEDF